MQEHASEVSECCPVDVMPGLEHLDLGAHLDERGLGEAVLGNT
jgi:hypothetical protein